MEKIEVFYGFSYKKFPVIKINPFLLNFLKGQKNSRASKFPPWRIITIFRNLWCFPYILPGEKMMPLKRLASESKMNVAMTKKYTFLQRSRVFTNRKITRVNLLSEIEVVIYHIAIFSAEKSDSRLNGRKHFWRNVTFDFITKEHVNVIIMGRRGP